MAIKSTSIHSPNSFVVESHAVVYWSCAISQLANSYGLSVPCMHACKVFQIHVHEAIAHVYHLVDGVYNKWSTVHGFMKMESLVNEIRRQ